MLLKYGAKRGNAVEYGPHTGECGPYRVKQTNKKARETKTFAPLSYNPNCKASLPNKVNKGILIHPILKAEI